MNVTLKFDGFYLKKKKIVYFGFRRLVIVKKGEKEGDEAIDVTPKEFSVRSVAQQYGGGDFSLSGDTIIFSNYKDQRLYKQSISSKGYNFFLCSLFHLVCHFYFRHSQFSN